MEIVPLTSYENLKRYLWRRKYQKITKLRDEKSPRRRWRITKKPSLIRLKKIFSPIKFVAKFHEAYIDTMNRMAGGLADKSTGSGAFSEKKVAKTSQISTVACGEELVDSKLVLEIYKRLAASRQNNHNNSIAF